MLKFAVLLAIGLTSTLAFAAGVDTPMSDSSVIKTSPLICGAITCRSYALEKAAKSGTLIRMTSCPMRDGDGKESAQPCVVIIRRDVTKGSIAKAIEQFDNFVSEDDGD